MNREIKFRAWDKACKLIHFMLEQSHKLPLPQPLHTYLENTERFDIMQFTGLQDKNGKDIYESDICREWLVDAVEEEGGFWNYYEIKFEKGCFVCKEIGFTYEKEGPQNLHECSNDIEIIGNIYENHELLNSQK